LDEGNQKEAAICLVSVKISSADDMFTDVRHLPPQTGLLFKRHNLLQRIKLLLIQRLLFKGFRLKGASLKHFPK
jgi:hypothetical protein